jgi:hypothetical protein
MTTRVNDEYHQAYLEDICPSTEPAINMNGNPPGRSFNTLRKCFQGCRDGIQLPSTVIGDDDAIYTVVDGKDDVFRRIHYVREHKRTTMRNAIAVAYLKSYSPPFNQICIDVFSLAHPIRFCHVTPASANERCVLESLHDFFYAACLRTKL